MSDTNQTESLSTESAKLILQNVSMLSELSLQLRRETKNGEHYLNSLNHLLHQAGKDVVSLHRSVDSLTLVAKKLVHLSLQVVPADDPNFTNLQNEANNLLSILDELGNSDEDFLTEDKTKNPFLKRNLSSKCLNLLEKYPEHCSRESLLGENVISLPTVHENVFANFNGASRTPSSSSLKSLRKVKLCLQKADLNDTETQTEFRSEANNPIMLGNRFEFNF